MKTAKLLVIFCFIFGISAVTYSQEEIDLLILNKKYAEALSKIDQQISQNPTYQMYFKKGVVFGNLQKYQEAVKAFSEALKFQPDNVEIISEIAEDLSILGNHQDAITYYKNAINIEPHNLALKAKLGRVYISKKEIKKAWELFSEIYAIDSTNVYWNKQFAFCSFQVGKRLQAVHLYEKVLDANPRDYGTYSNLIHSYSREKEPDKILATIDKGLLQFPGNAELILEKANFYFRTRNYEPAMIEFENYFTADGDSIYEIVMNYAISTYFSNDEKKAMKILGNLYRANPNDLFVMYYMSLCYKKMNDYENAEKYMQWAIDMSTPSYVPEMYHHLGQILGQQRKFKESIAALQKSNELDPTNVEALFEIATTYEEFNSNKTLALNYYRIYLLEAGESGRNVNYVLNRITRIKEEMFFEE
jgi:tetratricopeptide (TPR) repeat protein